MIYTVSEVSEITKLSKVSIYSRFKLKTIEPYLTKKQGTAYITEEGLKIILDDLKENIESPLNHLNEKASQDQDTINENKEKLSFKDTVLNQNKEKLSFKSEYISTLKDQLQVKDTQISEISLQLKVKDIQIQDLNNRLSQEQKLHENTQVLFKQQQPQEQLLLEAHFQDLDTKLEEVRGNMKQRKENQEHKSFFSKIFKGND